MSLHTRHGALVCGSRAGFKGLFTDSLREHRVDAAPLHQLIADQILHRVKVQLLPVPSAQDALVLQSTYLALSDQ